METVSSPFKNIRNIVFAGGGVKGIAYCGFLKVMEILWPGMYDDLESFCGSSIGSLFACLLCCGMNAAMIQNVILEADFAKMLVPANVLQMVDHYGLSMTEPTIGAWVSKQLLKHFGKIDITFSQMKRQTRRTLIVTVTNLTKGRTEYWSYRNHPDMEVREAIMCSMCFPLLFIPRKVDNDLIVDGGITDNFPVSVFPPETTLAVTLESPGPPVPMKSFGEYLWKLNSVVGGRHQHSEEQYVSKFIVSIRTEKFRTLDLFVDMPGKLHLIELGKKATIRWILENYYLPEVMKSMLSAVRS